MKLQERGTARLIQGFSNMWEAKQMAETYRAMVARQGQGKQFEVFMKPIPVNQGFGVYVRDISSP